MEEAEREESFWNTDELFLRGELSLGFFRGPIKLHGVYPLIGYLNLIEDEEKENL